MNLQVTWCVSEEVKILLSWCHTCFSSSQTCQSPHDPFRLHLESGPPYGYACRSLCTVEIWSSKANLKLSDHRLSTWGLHIADLPPMWVYLFKSVPQVLLLPLSGLMFVCVHTGTSVFAHRIWCWRFSSSVKYLSAWVQNWHWKWLKVIGMTKIHHTNTAVPEV